MRLSHIMLSVDGKSTLANVLVILQVISYTERETVTPAEVKRKRKGGVVHAVNKHSPD